jgi:hypothetical protein
MKSNNQLEEELQQLVVDRVILSQLLKKDNLAHFKLKILQKMEG